MSTPDKSSVIKKGAECISPQLLDVIQAELTQVREFIKDQLKTSSGDINVLLDETTAGWGKMLRPALVFLAGKCCGDSNQNHVSVAAVVELLHSASLLHDDVIDEADNRRGVTTMNVLRGNEAAVLLGDFLLSKVFAIGIRMDDKRIMETLSDTAVALCRGELLQNIHQKNWTIDEDTYLDIVRGKTAELFAASCYLGALVAGADNDVSNALREYGDAVGMAFQMTDDLLDIVGDETRVGKTLGTDMAKQKPTLPVIHLLQNADVTQREKIVQLLKSRQTEQLKKMMIDTRCIEYVKSQSQSYCEKAKQSLDILDDSPARQYLIELADRISDRCS